MGLKKFCTNTWLNIRPKSRSNLKIENTALIQEKNGHANKFFLKYHIPLYLISQKSLHRYCLYRVVNVSQVAKSNLRQVSLFGLSSKTYRKINNVYPQANIFFWTEQEYEYIRKRKFHQIRILNIFITRQLMFGQTKQVNLIRYD